MYVIVIKIPDWGEVDGRWQTTSPQKITNLRVSLRSDALTLKKKSPYNYRARRSLLNDIACLQPDRREDAQCKHYKSSPRYGLFMALFLSTRSSN